MPTARDLRTIRSPTCAPFSTARVRASRLMASIQCGRSLSTTFPCCASPTVTPIGEAWLMPSRRRGVVGRLHTMLHSRG
eukprot:5931016-Prymnesium_polylepis.2